MALKYNNSFKVSIPNGTYEQYRIIHDITGLSLQDMIRKALDEYLEKESQRIKRVSKKRF